MTLDGARVTRADDSVLLVVDVQEAFLEKLAPSTSGTLVAIIAWVARLARYLDVPILVTAEDVGRLGSITPELRPALDEGMPIYDKHIFNLAADPAILTSVRAFGRRTCVLVGLETDVCIAQSAIGLIEHGYQVIVLEDATNSPEHQAGLRRAVGAGALVVPVRTLVYEWLTTVEAALRFQRTFVADEPPPPGIKL